MPNKFTIDAIKLFLNAKNGWRAIVLALMAFVAWRVPEVAEMVKAKHNADQITKEQKIYVDSLKTLTKQFRISQITQDKRIRRNNESYEYLMEYVEQLIKSVRIDLKEVGQRDLEKGEILLEELDPVDSLGASLYMTNPGNLYYNHNGHFISVIKDRQKKSFYYLQGNKRIYLP